MTDLEPWMKEIRVSSKSNPNKVAGSIFHIIQDGKPVPPIAVIGAGALNQAVKAIAIARGFLKPSNRDLITRPAFADEIVDGREITAIRLLLEVISLRPEPT